MVRSLADTTSVRAGRVEKGGEGSGDGRGPNSMEEGFPAPSQNHTQPSLLVPHISVGPSPAPQTRGMFPSGSAYAQVNTPFWPGPPVSVARSALFLEMERKRKKTGSVSRPVQQRVWLQVTSVCPGVVSRSP